MPNLAALTFKEISVGDTVSFTTTITPELVDSFGALSGDQNPLHMDAAYAASTSFRTRVPHGMIAGMLFSQLVGMHMPGTHALYLSQTLAFPAPLPFGPVEIRGEVTRKTDAAQTITIATTASTAEGILCVRGEALVRVRA